MNFIPKRIKHNSYNKRSNYADCKRTYICKGGQQVCCGNNKNGEKSGKKAGRKRVGCSPLEYDADIHEMISENGIREKDAIYWDSKISERIYINIEMRKEISNAA